MSILSLIWISVGLILLTCLRIRYSRSRLLLIYTAILYATWYWVDRIFFQQTEISHLFPMAFTSFMLLFVSMLLSHTQTQQYFKQREPHDR